MIHTTDPRAEVEYWRRRVAAMDGIAEQLKAPTLRAVQSVGAASRSAEYDRWKGAEARLADARGEAAGNSKYLGGLLQRSMAPMYTGARRWEGCIASLVAVCGWWEEVRF